MFTSTRLWEALAYNEINQKKIWMVLDGYYTGTKFVFSGIKSYDGDVDIITIQEIGTGTLIDMIKNVGIIEIEEES